MNALYSGVFVPQGTRMVTASPRDVPAHPAAAAHRLSASRQHVARAVALLMRTRIGTRRAGDARRDTPARQPGGTGEVRRSAPLDARPTDRRTDAVRRSG